MSESLPDFKFDSLEPGMPITASQVDRSRRNVRTKEKREAEDVVPELTVRQKLGNKIFAYVLLSVFCWAALFMTWVQTTFQSHGFLTIRQLSDSQLTISVAGLTIPTWTIAGLASLGATMCVTNLLKLTGIKRRYVFATLGLAVFLTACSFLTFRFGRRPGLGWFVTAASTLSLLKYSWTNRAALR